MTGNIFCSDKACGRLHKASWLVWLFLSFSCFVRGNEGEPVATLRPAVGIAQITRSLGTDKVAKAEFAIAALSEMALALAVETDLARKQMASPGRNKNLSRWVISVDRYIEELLRLANSIDIETPIRLYTDAAGHLFLHVRRQSIMVSAPRMELQSSFEQRVIQQFCSQYPCDDAIERSAGPPAITTAMIGAPPRWSFSGEGQASCNSDDGLALQFESMSDLARKRELCLQLVTELRSVAAEIARQKDLGVRVEWDALLLRAIPGSGDYQLDLNSRGESLRLPLPTIASMPELLVQAQPWLQARSDNRQYTLALQVDGVGSQ